MINGNTIAVVQNKSVSKNVIGEDVVDWINSGKIKGFLDLVSGDSNYEPHNAKIYESSHVFISDYIPVDISIDSRLLIGGLRYDIKFIDNPMNLNRQLEIYLKSIGD